MTKDEYDALSKEFSNSPLVDSRETYGSNHSLGEFVRQTVGENPSVDLSNYGHSRPGVRYTEQVTVEFPPEQYEGLREQMKSTPIAEDKNGHYALAGNTQVAEYLRRCLRQSLNAAE